MWNKVKDTHDAIWAGVSIVQGVRNLPNQLNKIEDDDTQISIRQEHKQNFDDEEPENWGDDHKSKKKHKSKHKESTDVDHKEKKHKEKKESKDKKKHKNNVFYVKNIKNIFYNNWFYA